MKSVARDLDLTRGFVDIEEFAEWDDMASPVFLDFCVIAAEDKSNVVPFVLVIELFAWRSSVVESSTTNSSKVIIIPSAVGKTVTDFSTDKIGYSVFGNIAEVCTFLGECVGRFAVLAVSSSVVEEGECQSALGTLLHVFGVVLAYQTFSERST